ncbi:cation diffusion facilitator family transporter [Saccharibacillus sp. CPCC 101409]|uniref:cation diffusion facilitator family transporter n=1 Tax=Saccharibacillus sp. CPCC 101409 TaxID=3058041 RepID=UPI002673F331|nr:cation diffusion facilitator family transporter [Saccharibacillus sp. CPCC 101409]MDO3412181.1 cation diffusion facilitator family transporter [Saccharibacillus sp. CPCC 101409]
MNSKEPHRHSSGQNGRHGHEHDREHSHSRGSGGHTHRHGHGHNHSHTHGANKKALKLSFFLIASYMIVEVIGGLMTNSLALLSDAGHMLSDAAALGFSLLAMIWGERSASSAKTYGYKRFEVLAAFLNGIALLAISLYIFYEAFRRFSDPPGVMSSGMLTIAVIGLLVNVAAAWILMKGDTSENLNIRSAFLHVIGDLLGSVGAIAAALLIMAFGWNLADPIASVIVAVLVLLSAYRITRDSVHILMEGTPSGIDAEEIRAQLSDIEGVRGVHDLHIWSLSSDVPLLSGHLALEQTESGPRVMREARRLLTEEFGIGHITIQLDPPGEECRVGEESCRSFFVH